MCTAFCNRDFFGRNLDLQRVYGEEVTVTPRRFPLPFLRHPTRTAHYAMVGAATVFEEMPLYFEAVNERGLAMAGLSFERDCVYAPPETDAAYLAPFEVIPFVLSQCATVEEAKRLLTGMAVAAVAVDACLPVTPLHWMLCDREKCVAVEPLESGLCLRDDPARVLSNSPCLSYHLTHLSEYAALQAQEPHSPLFDGDLPTYHRGYGLKGLPGDFSSSSRFVKAAVVNALTPPARDEREGMVDGMRLLDSVAYPRGCVYAADGTPAITQYSCVCHLESGVYYYKTYSHPSVRAVALGPAKEGERLQRVPLYETPPVLFRNS